VKQPKLTIADLLGHVTNGEVRVTLPASLEWLERAKRHIINSLTEKELEVLRMRFENDPEALAEIDGIRKP